jgi:hypothetical protein
MRLGQNDNPFPAFIGFESQALNEIADDGDPNHLTRWPQVQDIGVLIRENATAVPAPTTGIDTRRCRRVGPEVLPGGAVAGHRKGSGRCLLADPVNPR